LNENKRVKVVFFKNKQSQPPRVTKSKSPRSFLEKIFLRDPYL